MKTEIIDGEMLLDIAGGSQADLDAFNALAAEKGWKGSDSMAGRMATAKMYQAVGMKTVKWNINTGEPAVFIDNAGGTHSFEEVYAKMKNLPNK